VVNGRVVTSGGASYAVLVIPGKHPMNPNGIMSSVVLNKLKQLANAGAKIIISKEYINSFSGIKNVFPAPYTDSSFRKLGVKKDVDVIKGKNAIAWTHRKNGDADIYFVANQSNDEQPVQLLFRIKYKTPEGWNPVNGSKFVDFTGHITDDGVMIFSKLLPGQSLFFVFKKRASEYYVRMPPVSQYTDSITINKSWNVQFNKSYGGITSPVIFDNLMSWPQHPDSSVKYYSGAAIYRNSFTINTSGPILSAYLQFDSIFNIASVKINGKDCGTLWTQPYVVSVADALKRGENTIEIEVTNTWHNRLIGDNLLAPDKRVTWTTAPFRLKDKPLLPAGLVGNVKLIFR